MSGWRVSGLLLLAMVVAGSTAAQELHQQLRPKGAAKNVPQYSRPRLWSDGKGTIYLVRSTERENLPRDVLFSRSVNGGESWEIQDLVIDRDKLDNARSRDPELLLAGQGRLLAVWQTKLRDGRKEIRFTASPDGGKSWPAQSVKINSDYGAFEPKIVADDKGYIHVTWFDERVAPGSGPRELAVYFTNSSDGGKSWPARDVKLSQPQSTIAAARGFSNISARPQIVTDGAGGVYVVWYDIRNRRGDLYLLRSKDYAQTWLRPEVLIQREAGNVHDFQFLRDPTGPFYLVWGDDRVQDRPQVRFSRSLDGGEQWNPRELRLDDSPAKAQAPRLTTDGKGNLYVVWHDMRNGEPDIYFRRSNDGGQTWAPPVRLDRDGSGVSVSMLPQVAADPDGRVVVAWQDDREGFYRIYLNASRDFGRTWLQKDVKLDVKGEEAETDHESAQVVLDGLGGAVVAWEIIKPTEELKKTAVQRVPLAPLFASQPATKKP